MKENNKLYFAHKVGMAALSVLLIILLSGSKARIGAQTLPMAENNLNSYAIQYSSLESVGNGYLRVFYSGDKIYVETYDQSFNLKSRKTVPIELDYYGGFYNGKDAYYFVFGKHNPNEITSAEVLRVVKYDRNWNRVKAASISGDDEFGHEVGYIFHYGNVSIDECDGMLYIATGHLGYVDPNVGQGHQGLLLFQVNETTMKGRVLLADLWHSFSQHLSIKDSQHIYLLEESEGSEQSQITRIAVDQDGEIKESVTVPVLKYGGERTSAWAVPTYASADAIAFSSGYVLAAGSSIDQSRYNDKSYEKTYNVYLTATPIDDFSEEKTKFRWVTKDNLESGYKNIRLTKITDDRFMLSWEQYEKETSIASENDLDVMSSYVLHYVFLNGSGEVISQEYKKAAASSNCEPIVKDGKVYLYAAGGNSVSFYSIDPQSGNLSKKVQLLAGENASWSLQNGVLTVSGTGEILMNDESDDDWSEDTFSFEYLSSKVKKIVISDGITVIGKNAFSGLSELKELKLGKDVKELREGAFSYCGNLKNVHLPKGLQKIGKKAFYGDRLGKIYIPKSAVSFGEQIFETGYYWIEDEVPVISTTVYCAQGSAALAYAKKNIVPYAVVNLKIKDRKTKATGKPVTAAKVTKEGISGDVAVLYYLDSACKTLTTTKACGSKGKGQAPVFPGIYYAKAQTKPDETFDAIYSNAAKIEIVSTSKYPMKSGSLSKSSIAKGQYVTDAKSKALYKVTKVSKKKGAAAGGNLTYLRPIANNPGSVTIPDAVKISGVSFKVTAIGKNACKNMKKLKKLVIGKNVSNIGSCAFQGCKNLKAVTVKTAKLTKKGVGKNAWKGLPAKAVIKTPKKMRAKYTLWFRGKGLNRKIAIT